MTLRRRRDVPFPDDAGEKITCLTTTTTARMRTRPAPCKRRKKRMFAVRVTPPQQPPSTMETTMKTKTKSQPGSAEKGERGERVHKERVRAFGEKARQDGRSAEGVGRGGRRESPQFGQLSSAKVLRMRPKCLDASSEDDEPAEPMRRRRAVHGMDDEEDED